MTPLFDMPTISPNLATGEDLREQIHHHLMLNPMLTCYEIARALNLPYPQGAGQNKVRRQLLLMEDDGEAEQVPGPRMSGDQRMTIRWMAT